MKSFMISFLKVSLFTILTMLTSLEAQAATFVPYQVIDSSRIRVSAPTNLVIRSKTEWQKFYLAATNWIFPKPSVPSIDFSKVVLIVVASGEKTTGGYKTLISSVTDLPTSIEVQAVLINPDLRCMVSQSFTYPVTMFMIQRTTKPFLFKIGDVYNQCI